MSARVAAVVPAEVALGYRLAGAVVEVAEDATAAAACVARLLAAGERGVIGVYEPHYAGLPGELRTRLEASLAPLVITIPSGLGTGPRPARRARLAGLLERAVGYHITFGGDG